MAVSSAWLRVDGGFICGAVSSAAISGVAILRPNNTPVLTPGGRVIGSSRASNQARTGTTTIGLTRWARVRGWLRPSTIRSVSRLRGQPGRCLTTGSGTSTSHCSTAGRGGVGRPPRPPGCPGGPGYAGTASDALAEGKGLPGRSGGGGKQAGQRTACHHRRRNGSNGGSNRHGSIRTCSRPHSSPPRPDFLHSGSRSAVWRSRVRRLERALPQVRRTEHSIGLIDHRAFSPMGSS